MCSIQEILTDTKKHVFHTDNSSSSDGLDDFLSKIKPVKKTNRYRLSTGSLSDFIVNSSSDNSSSPKFCTNGKKVMNIHSCEKFQIQHKKPLRKCRTEFKKRIPTKSVATPRRVVVFSSDSEDNDVFLPKVLRKNCSSTQHIPLESPLFTDSDKENQPNIEYSEPKTLHFSTESNDDDCVLLNTLSTGASKCISTLATVSAANNVEKLQQAKPSMIKNDAEEKNIFATSEDRLLSAPLHDTNSDKRSKTLLRNKNEFVVPKEIAVSQPVDTENRSRPSSCTSAANRLGWESVMSDSEDNEFVSLKDRLSSTPILTQVNDNSRPKIPLPSNKNGFSTPRNKMIFKPFNSEKLNRQHLKICSVKDCFLSSLNSLSSHNSGTHFKKGRIELTSRLFNFYNKTVFEHQLPENLQVSWSNRLTKTAGMTKCKKITKTYNDEHKGIMVSQKYEASIVLSEKVIDTAHRLRDTFIHEMCHAAVWVINNVNESHGPYWKFWANKARRIHPELPLIERCHNYDIEYKYRYQCTRYCAFCCLMPELSCTIASHEYYSVVFSQFDHASAILAEVEL